MLKFFRKIRQGLLSENKFTKYLLYASGEIVLVVLGILIALQINNWNERRKESAHEQKILSELKSDFLYNKQELNRNLIKANRLVNTCDSLILIFNLKNEDIDQKKIAEYTMLLSAYSTFDPSNGALLDLISSGSLNIIKHDSLRMKLSKWFGELDDIKEDEKRLIEFGDAQLNPIRIEYLSYNANSRFPDKTMELVENRKFENIIKYISNSSIYIIENYNYLSEIIDEILDDIENELK